MKYTRIVSSFSSDGSFRRLRSILFFSERLFGRFPLLEPATPENRNKDHQLLFVPLVCICHPHKGKEVREKRGRNSSQSAVGILFWIPRPPQAQIDLLDPRFLGGVLLPLFDHTLDLVQHASELVLFELFSSRSNRVVAPGGAVLFRWRWCIPALPVGRGGLVRRHPRLPSFPLLRLEPLLDEGGVGEAETGESDLGGGVDELGRGEARRAAVGLGFRQGGREGREVDARGLCVR